MQVNRAGEAALGAAAGAAAVWLMDRADWALWDRQPAEVRRRIEAVRPGGLDPAHVLVHRAAGLFGKTLQPAQPHPAGIALHYAIGMLPAAAYALARRRAPGLAAAGGLAFGLAVFLLEDELANPLMRTSAAPHRYPWQAHARGLVGHLIYGAALEAVLRALLGPPRRRMRRQQITAAGQQATAA